MPYIVSIHQTMLGFPGLWRAAVPSQPSSACFSAIPQLCVQGVERARSWDSPTPIFIVAREFGGNYIRTASYNVLIVCSAPLARRFSRSQGRGKSLGEQSSSQPTRHSAPSAVLWKKNQRLFTTFYLGHSTGSPR